MQTTKVREAREKLSLLLDTIAAGEEIIILRRGKPAARLVAADSNISFLDRSYLRQELPPMVGSAAEAIRDLRDEERY